MGSINPELFLLFVVALIVSLSIHEASHAMVANSLGDSTAKSLGRLTLNPLRHLDPLGTIFLLFMALSGHGIGWAKPVPVNPHNLRANPKTGMAIVSFAGPAANMALAAVFWLMMNNADPTSRLLMSFLNIGFFVNVSLAAFNLIPIPPLDGFRVLLGLLPNTPAYSLARLEPYGPAVLLLLVLALPGVLWLVLNPLRSFVAAVVTFGAL